MKRPILVVLLLAAVALAVLVPRGGPVAILGDGRDALLPLAPTEARIETDLVLLRRIENLRHVPDVARLCRGECDAALTAIVTPGPQGARKVLVADLDRFAGADALDRAEPLPEAVAACFADALRAEAAALRPAAPACLPSHRRLWRLPFGL